MKIVVKRRLRPAVEPVEDRCLLSVAAPEIVNQSSGAAPLQSSFNSIPAPNPLNVPNPDAHDSTNWSGYVAAANMTDPPADSVSAVYGSWIVPTITGPLTGTADSSTWVGIDGWGNNTVEQTGTQQVIDNGVVAYRAWWEMWSSGDKQPQQTIQSMTVRPGDQITASVQFMTSGANAGQFCLSIDDTSRPGDSFTTYQSSAETQSPLANRSTAEWIMEAPTVDGAISTIANFGSVEFTGASAVISGIRGSINASPWQSIALNIVKDGVHYDTTSLLSSPGTSFIVRYTAPVVTSPTATPAAASAVNAEPATVIGGPMLTTKPLATGVRHGAVTMQESAFLAFRSPIRQIKRPGAILPTDPVFTG